ncbi:MAG: FAD-dependent oxidoreductase [Syntrophothermus sp.]
MKEGYNHVSGKMTSGKNISYWLESVPSVPVFDELKENLEADVVIVGAGLGGLSVAYNLVLEGLKVVVVEDGGIGSGETGRTTAHLASALDDRFYTLQDHFGKEKTRIIAESHKAAIDFIEKTVQKEKISCDFYRVNGYLFLHPTDDEKNLKKEFKAAKEAGMDVVELPRVPNLLTDEGKCLQFSNQAQFHPMKYLNALAEVIVRNGGKIFTNTHASEIDHNGITSQTGYKVHARHIVIATNPPVTETVNIPMRQLPYRTYVIGAFIKNDTLPKALWWDTGNYEISSSNPPYHYVRLQNYDDHYDLLISGGEDHMVADKSTEDVPEENRYSILEDWTQRRFPIEKVVYRWSGQVMEPTDSMAYIGRSPFGKDNMYIVTGDSGHGMTHCTIAGMLIRDLIMGRENPWEKIYNPSRFSIKETGMFFQLLKDDLRAVLKKWFYKDNREISSISPGEAAIIKIEGEKCGVYRDEENHLHIVSTSCTHMRCMIMWNNDEKSWDCPCHGSRFTYDGKVITGPANSDLDNYTHKDV